MTSFTIRNYRGRTDLYHSSLRQFEQDNFTYKNLKESLRFYNLLISGEQISVANDVVNQECLFDFVLTITNNTACMSVVNLVNGQIFLNDENLELNNNDVNDIIVEMVAAMNERSKIKLEAYKYELDKLLSVTSFNTLVITPIDRYSVNIELN